MAKTDRLYRLVVFESIDQADEVRNLFCRVAGIHPTDAMQWIARVPGVWPHALSEPVTRSLLDGLYILGVPAEAWRTDVFPDLTRPRTIHSAACLPEGFRVKGLRGEPTHWVPWNKIELVGAPDGSRPWTSTVRSACLPGLPPWSRASARDGFPTPHRFQPACPRGPGPPGPRRRGRYRPARPTDRIPRG